MSNGIPPGFPDMPGMNKKQEEEQWGQKENPFEQPDSKQVQKEESPGYRKSSKYNAAQDFFPGMPMSKPEFKKFMSNLLNFISTQIKQEQKQEKEASEKLKQSEKGQ